MLWNLFKVPIVLLVGSIIVVYTLGSLIPRTFSKSSMLGKAAELSLAVAPWAGLTLLLCAVVYFFGSGYRLWRWNNGGSNVCSRCGGMVDQKEGRYGSYLRCLACGKSESS